MPASMKTKRVCKTVTIKSTAKLAPKSRSARITNPITGKVKTTASGKPVRSFALVSVNGKKTSLLDNEGNTRYFETADAMGSCKKIFNMTVYDELIETFIGANNLKIEKDFFPKYREYDMTYKPYEKMRK